MPYFENQGAQLYFEEKGQGSPLLFLHGASFDGRQWEKQVAYFSKNYHVITLDARGHGQSSLPPGKVSPDVFWQDVVALMDHLELSKAVICGLSMGAHVAIQVGIHAGERVEALILIGAIYTNAFNLYERMVVPVNRFSVSLMPMTWIARGMSAGIGNLNPKTKEYIEEVVSNLDHDSFNRVWEAVTSMESRDGLKNINCPTLILIGDHDTMTGRQQKYIHENIAGSKLKIIQNANHGTNLDNPIQVNQEIEEFLKEDVIVSEI